MERTSDDKKQLQAIKAIILNMTINEYAVERVAFGYEKIGEKAPIDLYLSHIFLGFDYEPDMRKDIAGVYIDEQDCISAEYDYDEYVHDLFVYQMERIFCNAPKDVSLECDGKEIPLLPQFRDYLFGTLPLFAEVMNVEVEYNAFDVVPTDRAARVAGYSSWLKLVTEILLNPSRRESPIDWHINDISNAPHYICRLIEKRDNDFYLTPVDVNSYQYIFALFSLMQFKNAENVKLLELKMSEWERRHRDK